MSNQPVTMSIPADVPQEAYFEALQVRSYEVGRRGTVRPGAIFRYLEHLATRASAALGFDHRWYQEHGAAWVIHELSIRFGMLPSIDDELHMATWVSEFRRVQASREYALWDAHSGRLVARARGRWAYIDRTHGQLIKIPEAIVQKCGTFDHAMRLRPPPEWPQPTQFAIHEMRLTAREYEMDSQQHINNCVYVDWLDEALYRAMQEEPITAPMEVRPRFWRIEYIRPARSGDLMRIATRIAPWRSRGLMSWQEMRNVADGEIMVRAHAEHLVLRAATIAGM
jgi:medium-chain acyl-[acyl-carrier-protein] hydrolase